ncbi:bcl-2-binding component 3 [Genypterus blacodes]|uniref:bcl-2-binding component 3 n=1 Tax=Genypterus blacodes TaxID=154954 RepID=UPI003F76169B
MARAETIESVGDAGGSVNGPLPHLPHHSPCGMELPRPVCHAWPSLLSTTAMTATSGAGTLHLHHHHLHPLRFLYLPRPLPYLPPELPEGSEASHSHQQLSASLLSPTLPPPPNQREERGGGQAAPSAFAEQSGSHTVEHQQASSRQGPLPDLLPQNELPSWALPRYRGPQEENQVQPEVRRVAAQLRAIGDDLNATMLRGAAVPEWQDWRDLCRGLLTFITQTLSTLYRLT